LNLIEFARKSAEVMNRTRRRHRGYGGARYIPVGGDAYDGSRTRKGITDGRPTLGVRVSPQGIKRISMTEEDGGHRAAHDGFFAVSVTPGFSPVPNLLPFDANRFNGFFLRPTFENR
jgi:hypothetical protein